MRLKLVVISLLSLCLFGGSCTPAHSFDSQLGSIVKPYRFSVVRWESRTAIGKSRQWLSGKDEESDQTNTVVEYFSLVEQIKSLESEIATISAGNKPGDLASLEAELNRLEEQRIALAARVEGIIARQIKEVLSEEGIFNPAYKYIKLRVSFPPLDFKLEPSPYLLVISPRDKIESMRRGSSGTEPYSGGNREH